MTKITVANSSTAVVSDADKAIIKTTEALTTDDPIELAKAQIALQRATVTLLQQIDWKLWELYNHAVPKNSDTKTK